MKADGFYAAMDADSEEGEGAFYLWNPEQIEAVLGDEAAQFNKVYRVTEEGNFEKGKTHLLLGAQTYGASRFGISS